MYFDTALPHQAVLVRKNQPRYRGAVFCGIFVYLGVIVPTLLLSDPIKAQPPYTRTWALHVVRAIKNRARLPTQIATQCRK